MIVRRLEDLVGKALKPEYLPNFVKGVECLRNEKTDERFITYIEADQADQLSFRVWKECPVIRPDLPIDYLTNYACEPK